MDNTGSVKCYNVLYGTVRFCKKSAEFSEVRIGSVRFCEVPSSTMSFSKVMKASPRFQKVLRGSGRFGWDLIGTSMSSQVLSTFYKVL